MVFRYCIIVNNIGEIKHNIFNIISILNFI